MAALAFVGFFCSAGGIVGSFDRAAALGRTGGVIEVEGDEDIQRSSLIRRESGEEIVRLPPVAMTTLARMGV
jgi:hypothetical protein